MPCNMSAGMPMKREWRVLKGGDGRGPIVFRLVGKVVVFEPCPGINQNTVFNALERKAAKNRVFRRFRKMSHDLDVGLMPRGLEIAKFIF